MIPRFTAFAWYGTTAATQKRALCVGDTLLLAPRIKIAYPFAKRVPFLRRFLMIEGDELPPLATPEYKAGLEADDLGVPDEGEPTYDSMIAEAKDARYGKIRGADHLLSKKPKKKPQGGVNQKGGKK